MQLRFKGALSMSHNRYKGRIGTNRFIYNSELPETRGALWTFFSPSLKDITKEVSQPPEKTKENWNSMEHTSIGLRRHRGNYECHKQEEKLLDRLCGCRSEDKNRGSCTSSLFVHAVQLH